MEIHGTKRALAVGLDSRGPSGALAGKVGEQQISAWATETLVAEAARKATRFPGSDAAIELVRHTLREDG
jgi:hypothetical protein